VNGYEEELLFNGSRELVWNRHGTCKMWFHVQMGPTSAKVGTHADNDDVVI
jgi:hypothetical protein